MPDSGFLVLSLLSIIVGVMLFLMPKAIVKFSGLLNRTMAVVDEQLIRHRYVMGGLAFVASYAFFKIALMLPALR